MHDVIALGKQRPASSGEGTTTKSASPVAAFSEGQGAATTGVTNL